MRYLVRFVFMLVLLAGVTVLGYATVGDLSAERTRTEIPVTLPQN